MKFSTRRGRPRQEKIARDSGTTELQNKRKLHLTSEPLDLCLEKGLISEEQHSAGLRLRWLHTLKLGAPNISAYSPEARGGGVCRPEDKLWIARKQAEYKDALIVLDNTKSRKIVVNTCIFNQMPGFLLEKPRLKPVSLRSHFELRLFAEGLEAISKARK